MSLDKKDIESGLPKKGFIKEQGKKHIKFFYYDKNGEKTSVITVMSRGSYKEIGDRVVSDMAKQCRLSNGEFVDLVECSLSHEDYDQHLRNIDVITE